MVYPIQYTPSQHMTCHPYFLKSNTNYLQTYTFKMILNDENILKINEAEYNHRYEMICL